MSTREEYLDLVGLSNATNKWLTLSEIGDNNIMSGYESSLSVIRPVTDVVVNDICMSSNFVGVVTEVYAGSDKNDLGLKGIKVKYEDPYNMSETGNYYSERVFVFGGESLEELETINVDTSHVNVVDMSSIKIVKRSTDTYKNQIEQLLSIQRSKEDGTLLVGTPEEEDV